MSFFWSVLFSLGSGGRNRSCVIDSDNDSDSNHCSAVVVEPGKVEVIVFMMSIREMSVAIELKSVAIEFSNQIKLSVAIECSN